MSRSSSALPQANDPLIKGIKPLMTTFVKPSLVLNEFKRVLTQQELDEVKATCKGYGDYRATEKLLEILIKKENWFTELQDILCHKNVKLQHIAGMMDVKKKNGVKESLAHLSLSRKDPEAYINENNNLKEKMYKLFEDCVEVESILHVFHQYSENVLTRQDIENVKAELSNHGNHTATQLLFERLVLYEDWFMILLNVLRDPGVSLRHVADKMEEASKEEQKPSSAGVGGLTHCFRKNGSSEDLSSQKISKGKNGTIGQLVLNIHRGTNENSS